MADVQSSLESLPQPGDSMESFGSGSELKSMESLLLAAQQQQLRQLRKLQQMRRQAELAAELEAEGAKKLQLEEEKRTALEADRERSAADKARRAAQAGALRRDKQLQARESAEEARLRMERKFLAAEERSELAAKQKELLSGYNKVQSARVAARREAIIAKNQAAEDARRAALLHKEEVTQRHLERKAELRAIQAQIRREEEAIRDAHRAEIRARAEQDLAAKLSYFILKQEERDDKLDMRQKEIEAAKLAKAREYRARVAYISVKVEEAGVAEQHRRQGLLDKLESKMARAELVGEQRQRLVEEMARIRRAMAVQESRMKECVDKMKVTGQWQFPEELLQELEDLTATIAQDVASPSSVGAASSARNSVGSPMRPGSSLGKGKGGKRATGGPISEAAAEALLSSREAELQRVLEEEIMAEMEREAALARATDPKERQRLLKAFAQDREAAKQRILSIGSQVLPNNWH